MLGEYSLQLLQRHVNTLLSYTLPVITRYELTTHSQLHIAPGKNLLSKHCTKRELQSAQCDIHQSTRVIQRANTMSRFPKPIWWLKFHSFSIFGTIRQILFCICKSFPWNTVLNTGQVKAYLHIIFILTWTKKKKKKKNLTLQITFSDLTQQNKEKQKRGWTAVKSLSKKISPNVSL